MLESKDSIKRAKSLGKLALSICLALTGAAAIICAGLVGLHYTGLADQILLMVALFCGGACCLLASPRVAR